MKPDKPRIPIATNEGLYFFSPDEIIRLEASSNYTHIFFTNKKKMLISKVLKEYEQILEPMGFLRTHRSHLINREYISFVDHQGNIQMRDSSKAEVSRRKRKDVLMALKNHLQSKMVA